MKDSFTLNDLFLCAGIGSESELEMRESIENSWSSHPVGPDPRIIRNIMSYSRALSVIETKRAGQINLLLN